jgi:hypothetical protein
LGRRLLFDWEVEERGTLRFAVYGPNGCGVSWVALEVSGVSASECEADAVTFVQEYGCGEEHEPNGGGLACRETSGIGTEITMGWTRGNEGKGMRIHLFTIKNAE